MASTKYEDIFEANVQYYSKTTAQSIPLNQTLSIISTIDLLKFTLFINYSPFLAPLLLLELLSYWHASNSHSLVPISGSARVSAIPQHRLFLSLSLLLFRLFSYWVEWGDADWQKRITTIQPRYFTDVTSDWKGIRIVRQWNKMIQLMICVSPDARMLNSNSQSECYSWPALRTISVIAY